MNKKHESDSLNPVLAVMEEYGCTVLSCENGQIEIEFWSELGEDVVITLEYDENDDRVLARSLTEYAENFDPEEHAEMWMPSRGKNGVPNSIRALLEDADDIADTLDKMACEAREACINYYK